MVKGVSVDENGEFKGHDIVRRIITVLSIVRDFDVKAYMECAKRF